jgi:hypothetical protein
VLFITTYLKYKLVADGFRFMVFNNTFNNISVISWQSDLLVKETGVPGENHYKLQIILKCRGNFNIFNVQSCFIQIILGIIHRSVSRCCS